MITINESGMQFLPLPKSKTFLIERSFVYQKLSPHHVATVEFITMGPRDDIVFVEAKTSAPNENDKSGLQGFVEEIHRKFSHSLQMCYAMLSGVLPNASSGGIPSVLAEKLQHKPKIKFVLIVNKLSKEHCIPLRAMLSRQMRAQEKIWQMNIIVLNREMALRKKMIKEI
ncbi:hypothetical protein [uncultured Mitsuokella sp.]|uniref:hypothetical protein n=1 Tax=uncultured Mitsuokella sp. TaxID=453120 RepID=UPI0025E44DF9|nr:hypothetical protein [uncultured Mitsuokella sp.]